MMTIVLDAGVWNFLSGVELIIVYDEGCFLDDVVCSRSSVCLFILLTRI